MVSPFKIIVSRSVVPELPTLARGCGNCSEFFFTPLGFPPSYSHLYARSWNTKCTKIYAEQKFLSWERPYFDVNPPKSGFVGNQKMHAY